MASLSSLRRNLNYWNNQADELDDEIRQLKRRRSDVKSVKSSLKSTSGSNSGDVNYRVRQAGQKLDGAIEYSGKESRLAGIFAGKAEPSLGADGDLSAADNALQRELDEIEGQLGEAESDLSRAKSKVRDSKSAIAAEERRQRDERNRKAAESVKR